MIWINVIDYAAIVIDDINLACQSLELFAG